MPASSSIPILLGALAQRAKTETDVDCACSDLADRYPVVLSRAK
jgi:hypothetical protein